MQAGEAGGGGEGVRSFGLRDGASSGLRAQGRVKVVCLTLN